MPKDIGYDKEREEGKIVKKGIRRDPNLYDFIINAYEASKRYLEYLNVPQDTEKFSRIYYGKIWEHLGSTRRSRYLSKVRTGLEFDIIETGLIIATSRDPMPDIEAEIGVENEQWQKIKELQELAETAENENEAESLSNQAEQSMDELRERLSTYAAQMEKWLVKDWKQTNMHIRNQELYREKAKTGDGYLKSTYDSEKEGMVDEICDQFTIYPAPNVPSIEAHMKMKQPFIYAPVMTVKSAMERYGINGIDESAIGEYDNGKVFKYRNAFTEKIWSAIQSRFASKHDKKQQYVMVLECWMPSDDDDVIEVEDFELEDGFRKKDDEGNDIKTVSQRPAFSSGFKVVTVIVGNKDYIVAEEENLYREGIPPFFHNKNFPQANCFHGISELKHLSDLIMKINSILSTANDNLKLTGNPKLSVPAGTKTMGKGPITNRPGEIYITTGAPVSHIPPPPLGADYKYLFETFLGLLDRVSHLADAVRGASSFAGESGRKVRELRLAATGLFQAKIDEQIKFSQEIFKHRVYILQNLFEGSLLQKAEDVDGKDNFEEFIPSLGRDINLNVSVSNDSILPKDINSEFEEGLLLYDRKDKFGNPIISEKRLIELAPTLDNKTELIKEYENINEQSQIETQRQQAVEAFNQLAEGMNEIQNAEEVDIESENELLATMIETLVQNPELIGEPAFLSLPDEIRDALLRGMAELIKQNSRPQLLEGQEVV